MALTFDTSSNGSDSTTLTNVLTVAHTCTGSELILVVGVQCRQNPRATITGVTYNGVAMTQAVAREADNWGATEDPSQYIYYLVGPATGANNIVATASGNAEICLAAVSYTGANATQSGATGGGTGSASDPSITVASASGEVVVDFGTNAQIDDMTPGADQTERVDALVVGWNRFFMSTEPGAASVTMSWTGTDTDWTSVGFAIQPAAGAAAANHWLLMGV